MGEDFRSIVEMMSVLGQPWGQGLIGPDDLDKKMLVWERSLPVAPSPHNVPTARSRSRRFASIATGETEPNVTSTTGAVIAMSPGQGRGSPLTSGAGGQRGSPRRIAPYCRGY